MARSTFTASAFVVLASVLATLTKPTEVQQRSPVGLHRRTTQQVAVSCYDSDTYSVSCACPTDLNGDSGTLINVYPGYQCAYPGGACTWSDKDGSLQNTQQTNCPSSEPCPSSGCSCPIDNYGDNGVMINQFTGYQCAYTGGACTWDFDGNLQNTHQTNCPTQAKCVAPSTQLGK